MPWQRSLRLLVGECIRLLARVKSWGWSSLRRLDEDGTEKESYPDRDHLNLWQPQ